MSDPVVEQLVAEMRALKARVADLITLDSPAPGGSAHAAVTLSAGLDSALLGLSTQQLTLDNQDANKVLAGPASGGAAAPGFRALDAADLPSHAHTSAGTGGDFAWADITGFGTTGELADVDLAAENAGASTLVARADHKHDLSEAIAPTWTAKHIWNPGTDATDVLKVVKHADSSEVFQVDTTNKIVRAAALKVLGMSSAGYVKNDADGNLSGGDAGTVDIAADFTWTGLHTFQKALNGTSVFRVLDQAGNPVLVVATSTPGVLISNDLWVTPYTTPGFVKNDADGKYIGGGTIAAAELPAHTHQAANQGGDYSWADIDAFVAATNWTPSFTSSGATFAYTQQVGRYMKVSNRYFISGYIALNGAPGGTTSNALYIAGLPANLMNLSNYYPGFAVGSAHLITFPANYTQLTLLGIFNSATILVRVIGSGQSVGSLTAGALGSGAHIAFSGSFEV